jgi:hypothetical protein
MKSQKRSPPQQNDHPPLSARKDSSYAVLGPIIAWPPGESRKIGKKGKNGCVADAADESGARENQGLAGGLINRLLIKLAAGTHGVLYWKGQGCGILLRKC